MTESSGLTDLPCDCEIDVKRCVPLVHPTGGCSDSKLTPSPSFDLNESASIQQGPFDFDCLQHIASLIEVMYTEVIQCKLDSYGVTAVSQQRHSNCDLIVGFY